MSFSRLLDLHVSICTCIGWALEFQLLKSLASLYDLVLFIGCESLKSFDEFVTETWLRFGLSLHCKRWIFAEARRCASFDRDRVTALQLPTVAHGHRTVTRFHGQPSTLCNSLQFISLQMSVTSRQLSRCFSSIFKILHRFSHSIYISLQFSIHVSTSFHIL